MESIEVTNKMVRAALKAGGYTNNKFERSLMKTAIEAALMAGKQGVES